MSSIVLWSDGAFHPAADLMVRWDDRGLLLGHGVFATMRGYGGRCFRADEHLEALAHGAKQLGIALPFPDFVARVTTIANEAAARTGDAEPYVRVTLTAGPASGPPTLFVVARPWDDLPTDRDHAEGIAVAVLDTPRAPPSCIDARVKTTSYAEAIVARREAAARGVFDGLQKGAGGTIACATMANVFVVRGNVLATPSLASGCRDGVTRRALLSIAPDLGLTVVEGPLTRESLDDADEVFLASTRVEALPVSRIDGGRVLRHFPRTAELRRRLRRLAGV